MKKKIDTVTQMRRVMWNKDQQRAFAAANRKLGNKK